MNINKVETLNQNVTVLKQIRLEYSESLALSLLKQKHFVNATPIEDLPS